ncbi:MAG: methyltransferase [Phycisphaerae bacterium]|nr:methyltransferase [Phycisphaerae bacterium]
MDELRGYPLRRESIVVGGRIYELIMPADSNTLLDDARVAARFARDEYMPYWATLWPAARVLADVVATWEPVDSADAPQVLELGGGIGLVGLVAAARGYRVTISDYDEDALAFAAANAQRNELPPPATRYVDWRETYADLRPERILAADVLYEKRHLEPIARFVRQHLSPTGFALISDAHRSTADDFCDVARACELTVEITQHQQGRVFRLAHATTR